MERFFSIKNFCLIFPLQISPMMRCNLFSRISNGLTKHIFGVNQAKSGYIKWLIRILTLLESQTIGIEHHIKDQVRFKGATSVLVSHQIGDGCWRQNMSVTDYMQGRFNDFTFDGGEFRNFYFDFKNPYFITKLFLMPMPNYSTPKAGIIRSQLCS